MLASTACTPIDPADDDALPVALVDLSAPSQFTERSLGFWKRGRTCAPADFDGDGRLDLFVGSPMDPALIVRNITPEGGPAQFTTGQLLYDFLDWHRTTWASAALDLDDDGDPDLFDGRGGNEDEQLDGLYLNEDGLLVEQPEVAPMAGPADLFGEPVPGSTAGVRWADLDLDGDLDLFVSTNVLVPGYYDDLLPLQPQGRDRLLRNDGGGVFTDVGVAAGLERRDATFQATLLDYDADGDWDLFQNVIVGPSRLWRNEVVETGTLRFTDVTMAMSPPGGPSLAEPLVKAFSSAAADLNGDGWHDLVVWHRGPTGPGHERPGHFVWLNLAGTGFVEVSDLTGLNDRWHECEDEALGVMGSQLADLDLDGLPDVFIGNGAPRAGCRNQLWLSAGTIPHTVDGFGEIALPTYIDASDPIDVPVPGAGVPYPYRTHGTCIADYDGDGRPELAFVNGGHGWGGDIVAEPNRFFDVVPTRTRHFLSIRPVGDGVHVNRDGIGTHATVTVRRDRDGATWDVHGTLFGGNGFSAHNGPELILGLADADAILSATVTWPDGTEVELDDPDLDTRITVTR